MGSMSHGRCYTFAFHDVTYAQCGCIYCVAYWQSMIVLDHRLDWQHHFQVNVWVNHCFST